MQIDEFDYAGKGGNSDAHFPAWLGIWLKPLLHSLVEGSVQRQSNIATYTLPVIFALSNLSLIPLLEMAIQPLKGNLSEASDKHVSCTKALQFGTSVLQIEKFARRNLCRISCRKDAIHF